MKRFLFIALVAAGLMSAAGASRAQTLNFNITATILPGVCRFTVADVDLGTYYATDFTAVGTVKPFVTVPIQSTGCDPLVTQLHFAVSGTADAASSAYFRGITGIGVELQSVAGTAIQPSGTTINYNKLAGTGAGSYPLQARLRQTAATVSAGAIRSAVTVVVTYN